MESEDRCSFGDIMRTGLIGSAATALTASALGAVEGGSPLGPVNAVSHIAWGDKATLKDEASVKYTLTGLGLHTTAVTMWATLFEMGFGARARRGDVGAALLGGAAVAVAAYVTDYALVPERLTPGFEKRLSPTSLVTVFGALALGLAVGGLMGRRN